MSRALASRADHKFEVHSNADPATNRTIKTAGSLGHFGPSVRNCLQCEGCGLKVSSQIYIDAMLHPESTAGNDRGIGRDLAVECCDAVYGIRLQPTKIDTRKGIEHPASAQSKPRTHHASAAIGLCADHLSGTGSAAFGEAEAVADDPRGRAYHCTHLGS